MTGIASLLKKANSVHAQQGLSLRLFEAIHDRLSQGPDNPERDAAWLLVTAQTLAAQETNFLLWAILKALLSGDRGPVSFEPDKVFSASVDDLPDSIKEFLKEALGVDLTTDAKS